MKVVLLLNFLTGAASMELAVIMINMWPILRVAHVVEVCML